VSAYLDEALDILQTHGVFRNEIDWPAFRARVTNVGRNARTVADAHQVVRLALTWIGDNHNRFMTAQQFDGMLRGARLSPGPDPEGRLVEERFGYIRLPAFAAPDEDLANRFATTVQELIRSLDSASPCGWIVDLRTNTGGNALAMLAAVGPLFGEAPAGLFVYPDGATRTWAYRAGQVLIDEETAAAVTGPDYRLRQPESPVAVLTGQATVSAGELIVVAFRQQPNTRSFGQATGGLTTAVDFFELSDGAMLLLAVATFADRIGQVYDGPIAPDETVADRDPDATMQAALDWLRDQPACAQP
jgi:C-terminal processing protease CtpA/Prc